MGEAVKPVYVVFRLAKELVRRLRIGHSEGCDRKAIQPTLAAVVAPRSSRRCRAQSTQEPIFRRPAEWPLRGGTHRVDVVSELGESGILTLGGAGLECAKRHRCLIFTAI